MKPTRHQWEILTRARDGKSLSDCRGSTLATLWRGGHLDEVSSIARLTDKGLAAIAAHEARSERARRGLRMGGNER